MVQIGSWHLTVLPVSHISAQLLPGLEVLMSPCVAGSDPLPLCRAYETVEDGVALYKLEPVAL